MVISLLLREYRNISPWHNILNDVQNKKFDAGRKTILCQNKKFYIAQRIILCREKHVDVAQKIVSSQPKEFMLHKKSISCQQKQHDSAPKKSFVLKKAIKFFANGAS